MAITCRDVITDALKLARVLSSGEIASADEAEDGLNCLQSFYDSLVFQGMFGTLTDVYLDSDDIAEEGKRYYVPAGVVLTAPTSEYLDSCGNVRQPRDLALYEALTASGVRTVRLYDRTAWVELTGLTLSSVAPLALRNRIGLAAALATSAGFAAMFADTATLNPDVRRAAQMFLGALSAKDGSTQDKIAPDYF
jgi:hypothetical protein